jgi:2-succinyl-5-enolpyruvyl-6-hydroxy-3-cyclohexene-1-carboxylate synthase
MRADLRADIEVERSMALINLALWARGRQVKVMSPVPVEHWLAAVHEAKAYLKDPGAMDNPIWLDAERTATATAGKTISLAQAALFIVSAHSAWASQAAALHSKVRSAEMEINTAQTVAEIHAALRITQTGDDPP